MTLNELNLDGSNSNGEFLDEMLQKYVDNLAENYVYADNDNQRASTDAVVDDFLASMCDGNKARVDYWTGVYNSKKKELADGLSGSQIAAE